MLITLSIGCTPTEKTTSETNPTPEILQLTLTSSIVEDKHTYPIHIALPQAYQKNKHLPVIYLLNGWTDEQKGHSKGIDLFNKTVAELQSIHLDAILVFIETEGRIESDYFNNYQIKSLQPTQFSNFLRKELIPFIDENYENNNDSRTLIGYGIGGNMAIWNMFLEEKTAPCFNQFIAASPIAHFAIFTEVVNTDSFPQKEVPLKIYLSSNTETDSKVFDRWTNQLTAKQYPWLSLKVEDFQNISHKDSIEPSINTGLKYVFEIK